MVPFTSFFTASLVFFLPTGLLITPVRKVGSVLYWTWIPLIIFQIAFVFLVCLNFFQVRVTFPFFSAFALLSVGFFEIVAGNLSFVERASCCPHTLHVRISVFGRSVSAGTVSIQSSHLCPSAGI